MQLETDFDMNASVESEQPVAKPSKKGLIIGVVLALAGAGGGFYVTYSGIAKSLLGGGDSHVTPGGDSHAQPNDHGAPEAISHTGTDSSFVPLEAITISLGSRSQSRHLRFSAQLEVSSNHAAEVQRLMPRIMDVLNIYLRALDPHELEEPAALLRLRAQMLRRVQIVTGPGFVNDLLVMEFVLN